MPQDRDGVPINMRQDQALGCKLRFSCAYISWHPNFSPEKSDLFGGRTSILPSSLPFLLFPSLPGSLSPFLLPSFSSLSFLVGWLGWLAVLKQLFLTSWGVLDFFESNGIFYFLENAHISFQGVHKLSGTRHKFPR